MNVQKIEIGKEKAVIVPENVWNKIMDALEDLDDIKAYDKAKANDCGTRVPLEGLEKKILGKRQSAD